MVQELLHNMLKNKLRPPHKGQEMLCFVASTNTNGYRPPRHNVSNRTANLASRKGLAE